MLQVELEGPFFDKDPGAEVSKGVDTGTLAFMDETREAVQRELDNVLVNPSGFYRQSVDVRKVQSGEYEVNDGGVVYGPWLEGVGSRNATSRFKGYATFRRVSQQMEAQAAQRIEQGGLDNAVEGLN